LFFTGDEVGNKVFVIGAGIVGISCAISLQRDGHDVVLIDKVGPCAGASFGNAGAIVNGSAMPSASPGILFDALKMLGKKGPLSVHPQYIPRILPWLIRFFNQSRPSLFQQNSKDLYAITQHANSSWHDLLKGTSLDSLLNPVGWLKVYEKQQSFDSTVLPRRIMEELGVPFEILSPNQLQELEPSLATIFKYGLFQRDAKHISNPGRLVEGLADYFVANGGEIKITEVSAVKHIGSDTKNRIKLTTSHGELYPDKLVVAAGAWSSQLTQQLGLKVPLDTERGYHLMLPKVSGLTRPVVNSENSFVICPMETGLRVTSQVELAGLNAKADFTTIRSLLPDVKRMLPDAKLEEESSWLGFRPSFPDSLPIIDKSKHQGVYYAFGHQHLGMTMGPMTGQIIADLVAKRDPKIDISPYRADRFKAFLR